MCILSTATTPMWSTTFWSFTSTSGFTFLYNFFFNFSRHLHFMRNERDELYGFVAIVSNIGPTTNFPTSLPFDAKTHLLKSNNARRAAWPLHGLLNALWSGVALFCCQVGRQLLHQDATALTLKSESQRLKPFSRSGFFEVPL